MGCNSLNQIRGTTIMQEEESLAESPQRCGAEHVRTGCTLRDTIGQSGAHVMQAKIRKGLKKSIA